MTTAHECPSCGASVECHQRDLGQGRQKPLNRYGPNHASVMAVLPDGRWWTVRQIQADLSQKGIAHVGKRDAWNYVAVQSVVSDLVGWGKATMERVPKTREWKYRMVPTVVAGAPVRRGFEAFWKVGE